MLYTKCMAAYVPYVQAALYSLHFELEELIARHEIVPG